MKNNSAKAATGLSAQGSLPHSEAAGRCEHIGWLLAAVILLVIIADQALKIWVKTSFYLGEDLPITSWFHLKFIENPGFAFGIDWLNKYVLTFGRIIAVCVFIWALAKFVKMRDLKRGFLISMALITAGAAGNIFDCVFYGEVFSDPWPPEIAQAFPRGGGYAGWFGAVLSICSISRSSLSSGLSGCPVWAAQSLNSSSTSSISQMPLSLSAS